MNYLQKSKLIIFIIGFCLSSNFVFSQNITQEDKRNNYTGEKAKYIFYFIGDGMGLSQSTATEAFMAALENKNGINKLSFSKFPVMGFYTTYAENRFITGSAAAGTAMATGHKTTINTIGLKGDKITSVESIAEKAKKRNYKVGIVSSVSIDHATPAAFYAHQPERNMYYHISCDLSNSEFNYFGGGGFNRPDGELAKKAKNNLANFGMGDKNAKIQESKNSFNLAKERGYTIYDTRTKFAQLKKGDDKVIAIAPRLVGGKALPYTIDSNKDDISLKEFTAKGIELLENEEGFFMMVEGGKIDWACHANDAATVIREVIAFNEAVEEAVKFYNKHPKETLIIVAGDHETGGLGLGFSGKHYESAYALLQHQNVSYEGFSNIIKDYKKNNKRHKFNDILTLVTKHFGLGDASKGLELSDYEMTQLKDAYAQSMRKKKNKEKTDSYYLKYGNYEPLTITACHILSQKSGVAWTSFSHTAMPIPVRAMGVGSDLFNGFFDNTDLPKNIEVLLK